MKAKSTRTGRVARSHHEGTLAQMTELTLSKSASHHLVTVLRSRQGDLIDLFNGDGYDYRASIIDTGQRSNGKCAVLQIHERTRSETESPVHVELVQGVSRGDRMDTTLRQAVELGVGRICPVYTRYSARELDEKRTKKKMQHWQSIVTSACEQSGRARLPELTEPVSLDALIMQWEDSAGATPSAHRFVLSPTASESLVSQLHGCASASSVGITLITGPESGLDTDEVGRLQQAGAQVASLGPRILRTETAGPACVALVQATLGDLA